jgi:hypothetical protein
MTGHMIFVLIFLIGGAVGLGALLAGLGVYYWARTRARTPSKMQATDPPWAIGRAHVLPGLPVPPGLAAQTGGDQELRKVEMKLRQPFKEKSVG